MVIHLKEYRSTKHDFFENWHGLALHLIICRKIRIINASRFGDKDFLRIFKMLEYTHHNILTNPEKLCKLTMGMVTLNYISGRFSCYHLIYNRNVDLYWQVIADKDNIIFMLFQHINEIQLNMGFRYNFEKRTLESDGFVHTI